MCHRTVDGQRVDQKWKPIKPNGVQIKDAEAYIRIASIFLE
jgi:hypothetical protein